MFRKLSGFFIAVLVFSMASYGFAADDSDDKSAELKANALELLRETTSMALALNSPTNRINFTIKSADVLWNLDEADARGLFTASNEDVRRLMTQLDIEMNRRADQQNQGRRFSGSRRSRNETSNVLSLRSNLINSLANHDPEWAMRMLKETGQIFTNKSLIRRIERDNKRLEMRIISKIASKDVTKALELAREKLSRGVSSEVVSLLNQIYLKDREKGAEFAGEVLSKLKSSTLTRNQNWVVVRLFQNGLQTADREENPLYDRAELNELGKLLADIVAKPESRFRSLSPSVMKGLEKFAPSDASRIKRIFEARSSSSAARRDGRSAGVSYNGRDHKEHLKFQTDLSTDFSRLNKDGLSAEEQTKILVSAMNRILGHSDERRKFDSLLSLAIRAANLGDKETAQSVLDAAEGFVNQDPKERSDFAKNRGLANAYSYVDTNRSFSILESMAYRLNGVVDGYLKYMEYSGNNRVIENQEMIMNSRSRQFTGYFRLSMLSLKALANEDYARLKELTDKFDRAEVRIEVRLQLAKALLSLTNRVENDAEKKTKAAAK